MLAHTCWTLSRAKVTLVSIRARLVDRRTTSKADTKMVLSQRLNFPLSTPCPGKVLNCQRRSIWTIHRPEC